MQAYPCSMHASEGREVRLHLQETLSEVFALFGRLITRRQDADPEAMGRTDYLLLSTLEHEGDGLRSSQLAEVLGNDASTISRRLTCLESQGRVDRLPDPRDGRASIMRLAPEGLDALALERAARSGLLADMLDGWPDEDVLQLHRLMSRLADDLGRDPTAATRPSSSTSQRSTS